MDCNDGSSIMQNKFLGATKHKVFEQVSGRRCDGWSDEWESS